MFNMNCDSMEIIIIHNKIAHAAFLFFFFFCFFNSKNYLNVEFCQLPKKNVIFLRIFGDLRVSMYGVSSIIIVCNEEKHLCISTSIPRENQILI